MDYLILTAIFVIAFVLFLYHKNKRREHKGLEAIRAGWGKPKPDLMKTDASTWWWNQFTDILQVLRLCLFLAIANEGMAQAPDTLAADRPVGDAHYFQRPGRDGLSRAEKQKRVIVKEHIAFTSVNLVLSATESQIIDMENLECNALLKRDTSALKKIWMRDFTLDAPQNDLLLGQNPIPYYIYISRLVDKFNAFDNMVVISGLEISQILNTNGKAGERTERKYTHTWINRFGVWKLSSKTYQ